MKLLRVSLLSLSGLLVAAALAVPGVIGPKVEEIWKQQLGRLQGGKVESYRRGWFGAQASTELASGDGNTQLRSDIQHGPLLFTARGPRLGLVYSETRLSLEQLAPDLRAQLEQVYGRLEHSPLVLESLVLADNRVINYLRVEPFTRSDSGGELKFDGAEVLLETDYSGAVLSGTIQVGEVRRSHGGLEQFYSEPASGAFRFVSSGSGEANIELPLLRADSESGPLELRDSSLRVNTEILPSGELKLATDLQVPQVQSATPVTSLQQQMTLPKIAAADLGHFLNALLLPAAQRDWPRVMQRPLQLQQQLAIESANGPVLVDADVNWRGMPAGARPDPHAVGQWLEPLSGSMTFSAAEQALMQSPLIAQAMTLRRYGLLVENNGELQMYLQVDSGQLQVNGQLLPPDLFMLALLGEF